MLSAEWWPFCRGLDSLFRNILIYALRDSHEIWWLNDDHCWQGAHVMCDVWSYYWQTIWIFFNSLWPSGILWWHRSGSTLAQVMACCLTASMACCLTAPSHYLNQFWLIISKVLWHSPEENFIGHSKEIYPDMTLNMTNSRLQPHFPGANELEKKIEFNIMVVYTSHFQFQFSFTLHYFLLLSSITCYIDSQN